MRTVLVTTANGMFGRALVEALAGQEGVQVRAMVRDRSKFTLKAANIEVVEGDLDRAQSLEAPMQAVSHVFLSSPISDQIGRRYRNVVDAALKSGKPHIAAIFGAVNHQGDSLDAQYAEAIGYLKRSTLPWTLVSPTSVMETALGGCAATVGMGCVLGISGDGKNALVANRDVARVAREVILGSGHEGQDYKITGPQRLDMADICSAISGQIGRRIAYYDLPEAEFTAMMLKNGEIKDPAVLEEMVICHLRAWKEGRADVITDTFSKMTGESGTTLEAWLADNHAKFDAKPSLGDRAIGFMLRRKYGKYA